MIKRYDLYLNTPELGVVHAADVALLEEQQRLVRMGFRYTAHYLSLPDAFALDPAQLPLGTREITLECKQAAPAIIDDYLPDAWGKKVLAKLAIHQHQQRLNANSVIESLGYLQQIHTRIGAIALTEQGHAPAYATGIALPELQHAEAMAQKIEQEEFTHLDANTLGLIYLANSGTGIGGARPKALVHDQGVNYLAKFNSHRDGFNNARVELACLLMAQAAGIEIGCGKIVPGLQQREVLLLQRFDISHNARLHLMSANGLLKQPNTQQDPGASFRYDDLYNLLQRYSCNIEADLLQLLRLMLFNRAINNTDDHERNFSFIHRADGYQLAPAYDLVPSLAAGEYHAAGFGTQPYPPTPSEAETMGRIFGLPKGQVANVAQQVRAAVLRWQDFAELAGVNEAQMVRIGKLITT